MKSPVLVGAISVLAVLLVAVVLREGLFTSPGEVFPSPAGVGVDYRYEQPDGTDFYFWFVDGIAVKASWELCGERRDSRASRTKNQGPSMRLLDAANDRQLSAVAMYLTREEALALHKKLRGLLDESEANAHFHMCTDKGDWSLSCSIVTSTKTEHAKNHAAVAPRIEAALPRKPASEISSAPFAAVAATMASQREPARGSKPAPSATVPPSPVAGIIYADFRSFFEGVVVFRMLLSEEQQSARRKSARADQFVGRFRHDGCVWKVPENFDFEALAVAHARLLKSSADQVFQRISDSAGPDRLELAPAWRENPGGAPRNFRFEFDE